MNDLKLTLRRLSKQQCHTCIVTYRSCFVTLSSYEARPLQVPPVMLWLPLEHGPVFVGLKVIFRGERCLVRSSLQSGQNHSLSSSIAVRPRHDRWYAFGQDSQQIRSVWWAQDVFLNTRIYNWVQKSKNNRVTKHQTHLHHRHKLHTRPSSLQIHCYPSVVSSV